MSSYFPFSSSSKSLPQPTNSVNLDDPHLQVTITPSASAYYAGETFSVTITFTNTRTPPIDATYPKTPISVPPTADIKSASSSARQLPSLGQCGNDLPIQDFPTRKGQIGVNLPTLPLSHNGTNAEAGPSRITTPLSVNSTPGPPATELGYPYSPGANPAYRAPGWSGNGGGPTSPTREKPMNFRSPDGWTNNHNGKGRESGHGRRTRSLALGQGTMSPQELVWALGGQLTAPPLPSRRPQSAAIPSHHPHSRKISVTNFPLSPPSDESINQTLSPSLQPVIERQITSPSAGTSRPPLNRGASSTSSMGTSGDDETFISNEALTRHKSRPTPSPLGHGRTPSYHNAYGASYLGFGTPPPLPPPTHPYIRERIPADRGTTTILWAYTRLVAHFHPSNTYIPPDPLLPLRSMLLHQPVGSGSLNSTPAMTPTASNAGASSRWQLSFGTGTIGNATQPSLTGSLFGLAKDLVLGGGGGSLEEERKRVWNMKDLPVLETTRSLLGVDVKLKEGESREYTYSLPLPTTLPPAHRGKAFRFSYDLIVSLNVALPGGGGRQKSKDISIPIRVWTNVSVSQPFQTYDVLRPVIQTKDEGSIQETETEIQADQSSLYPVTSVDMRRRSSASDRHRRKTGDTEESLKAYAHYLLDTVKLPSSPCTSDQISPKLPPLSPVRSRPRTPRSQVVSPSSSTFDIPPLPERNASFLERDDELVEESAETGCGEAVEILSRHSSKASYDIAKDGDLVAVLTLIKTTYRLGETVLGVVSFNQGNTSRRVLKFSAFLESRELIPQTLLPPPGDSQPTLARLHAEHRSSYVISSSRIAFSLDIPSDATPGFSLMAGEEGNKGGLEWKVKLQFVVAVPHYHQHHLQHQSNGHRRSESGIRGEKSNTSKIGKYDIISLLPSSLNNNDNDNQFYTASTNLTPLLHSSEHSKSNGSTDLNLQENNREKFAEKWEEMNTELVECEIPVKVLAGNTAFIVRPSIWVI
ncbi:uncharacterized protein I206_103391 [Kwoniella pini CBS 10737]|uniref:Rgp1-domain-containing protein n=1 Tax=Kwoniella pini CBS 10737 TaxID=1296096 RepID=A0A1B9I9U6_9TREE|nr:uncharacterized protein I206_01605 [Kwoniella pini CBS 10737]OCF52316.1 hypothetical protein I206_01605 [Kwoniella pini CBS 10737]